MASSGSSSSSFKRFDVVSDFSDNVFRGRQPYLDSRAQRTILNEWRVLEDALPDSINVRVFETRIDLMTAAIAGAQGTPYHDGLFFFDVQFPSGYPNHPPAVSFRSHGERINPNLYASGRVCLSLLATWSGRPTELWDPRASTVLQVLVSIQALVLNEKPYFNEPGSGGLLGPALWERASDAYNESVFLLAVKMVIYTLRDKPANFEDFVVDHFRARAPTILGACAAYAGGRVRVGYFAAEEMQRRRTWWCWRKAEEEPSARFREGMQAVYGRLVGAFRENEIEVSADMVDFREVLRRDTADHRGTDGEDGGGGTLKKFFDKLSELLGLKSDGIENGNLLGYS